MKRKRAWIQKVVAEKDSDDPEKCIFTNIGDIAGDARSDGCLHGATAFCATRQKECLVPACGIFVCGTSCKDISQQGSVKGRGAGGPVLQGSWSPGGSAQTFHGLIGYVRWAQPSVVLFENVDNVTSEQQDDAPLPSPPPFLPGPAGPSNPPPRTEATPPTLTS